eukprot:354475-Chlamydomonas_euryale.AAC.1
MQPAERDPPPRPPQPGGKDEHTVPGPYRHTVPGPYRHSKGPLQGLDRDDLIRDIGAGNFGVAKLMRDKVTSELVSVKFTGRGSRVSADSGRIIAGHLSAFHVWPMR